MNIEEFLKEDYVKEDCERFKQVLENKGLYGLLFFTPSEESTKKMREYYGNIFSNFSNNSANEDE